MYYIIYVIKILLYILLMFGIYFDAKKNKTFPKFRILLYSILFGIVSLIYLPDDLIGDRAVYANRFSDIGLMSAVKLDSIGLYYLYKVLHIFTLNYKALFFIVSFCNIFITLSIYNKYDNRNSLGLILILLSYYSFFGISVIKQSFALSFASLAIVNFDNNKKIKSLIFAIISILFHESAIILLLILLVYKLYKYKAFRYFSYAFLIILVILFKQLNPILIKTFINIFPNLIYHLQSYINNNFEIVFNYTPFTALKGLPFLFIFLFSIINRKKIKNNIKDYDFYTLCSFFIFSTCLLSVYMYWLFRLGLYLFYPVFIFAGNLYNNIENKKNKILFLVLIFFPILMIILKELVQYFFLYGGI